MAVCAVSFLAFPPMCWLGGGHAPTHRQVILGLERPGFERLCFFPVEVWLRSQVREGVLVAFFTVV